MTQTETDTAWQRSCIADPYPNLPAPAIAITPWTSDVDLDELTADLVDVYPGADAAVLAELLRDLRRHLRTVVMASAVRDVADGLADVVDAATTDAELELLVVGAEAGRGVSMPGLLAALGKLRGAAGVADAAA